MLMRNEKRLERIARPPTSKVLYVFHRNYCICHDLLQDEILVRHSELHNVEIVIVRNTNADINYFDPHLLSEEEEC